MKSFEEQFKRDIEKVFHNTKEFARMTRVEYNGKDYDIPVVFEREGAKSRKRPARDNAEGLFIGDLSVFIARSDLDIVPRRGTRITIDGEKYGIIEVRCNGGEIVLDLEMYDE